MCRVAAPRQDIQQQKFLVIGHRGAAGHAPENTLLSVRKALALGVDAVEVDVYFVDGELVVIHDDTLERTTNGIGPVCDHSFDDLRALDAGDGEQIPTLREVFETVDRKAMVNIELKGPKTAGPSVALIEEFVRDAGWPRDSFLVSSFEQEELRRAREADARVRRGLLSSSRWSANTLETARELEAWSLNLALKPAGAEAVSEAHRQGLKVFVYTVNSAQQAIDLELMDVNGVFTDYPDIILHRHQDPTAAA